MYQGMQLLYDMELLAGLAHNDHMPSVEVEWSRLTDYQYTHNTVPDGEKLHILIITHSTYLLHSNIKSPMSDPGPTPEANISKTESPTPTKHTLKICKEYDSDDADVMLISSDNYQFKVHSYRLQSAS